MSLILDNITFGYKAGHDVLRDFRAEFSTREITALTGENGSGKSTLARIIMGILPQQSGRIFLEGECLDSWTIAQRGQKIGYVMQNPARQIFSDTVEKEIDFGLQYQKLSPKEQIKRRETYLSFFGLEPYRDRFPQLLSHGEKQRLMLAAVLAMEPSYLILDEPTANLDFSSRKRLGEKLKELRCGIMIISHDQEFVKKYCIRAVRMEEANGKT